MIAFLTKWGEGNCNGSTKAGDETNAFDEDGFRGEPGGRIVAAALGANNQAHTLDGETAGPSTTLRSGRDDKSV
jgi:hypothetical protein